MFQASASRKPAPHSRLSVAATPAVRLSRKSAGPSMPLVGGINTTLGPIVGAMFVTMFPAVVNIDPWIQEMLYGALSIFAITVFPEGVVGLVKRRLGGLLKPQASERPFGRDPGAVQYRSAR